MASTADAIALPWPSAQRPAANAIAKPATTTEYAPTMLPPDAGASAASATPGIRTAIAARISERTPALLCTCGVLVGRMWLGMSVLLVVLGPFDGAGDV